MNEMCCFILQPPYLVCCCDCVRVVVVVSCTHWSSHENIYGPALSNLLSIRSLCAALHTLLTILVITKYLCVI